MQRGLGRCVSELAACKDKEPYRQTVLWGCLHNPSFDTQCEGTRAEYLYELASLYEDDEYFLAPVLEKFDRLPANSGWDHSHFCDLLCCFAESGHDSVRLALHKKYDEIYARLLTKRNGKSYDFDRDNFESVGIAIVSLEGKDAFLKIAADMGNLFLRNKRYDGFDFEWFYICFENRQGKKRLAALMEREGKKSAALKTFYEKINQVREESISRRIPPVPTADEMIALAENGEMSPKDRVLFRRRAEEEQKRLLAQAVLDETDSDKKAELLRTFTREGFPFPEKMIPYVKSEHEELRDAALSVLSDSQGGAVHDFAIELIQAGQHTEKAVSMLIMNYRKQDKELLLSCLDQFEIDYEEESGWHGVVLTILDAFSKKVKLPKETLLFIYEKSLCSCCREYAVRNMAKRKWLSDEIKVECAHDSNLDIREYVSRLR